jgi:hypothetical protein
LYWGFVPFLIESFPYDCTELGTYSQLHDWREAALKKDDSTSRWVASVPDQVRPDDIYAKCICNMWHVQGGKGKAQAQLVTEPILGPATHADASW